MLRGIIQSAVRFRLLIISLAAATVFFGVTQLRNAPVDILPEFSEPFVEVQTEALGLSAVEVEQLITVPLEADLLNGVAWLKTIRSKSIPGLSSIVLIFEPGTDILRARQMVQERLTQAVGLPNVSKPSVMLQPLSSMNRVMQIGLTARDISDIEMSVLTRWTIRPRLMGVPGVANVSVWGMRNRQLQVQVDPQHLSEKGVTLNQVIKTTGDALWVSPLTFLEASTPGTGGWIDTPNQRLGVRHFLPITSSKQLAEVSLAEKPMLLKDVARVVEDHQPLIGDAVVNGGPGLMIVVEKFPWANTLEVTHGVEKALEAMRPGLTGIEFDATIFRPATFVETAFSNLGWSLTIGGVLALVVLFAFLFNWRTALICSSSIVVSLLAAGLVLYLYGTTFNIMILAGLAVALGVIIDDAIVGTENIARRLREETGGEESVLELIARAAFEMRSAMAYAMLIVLVAVLPVFALPGFTGSLMAPLAASLGLAVLISMVVALTVTPALSAMLLSRDRLGQSSSPPGERLYGALAPAVAGMARKPAAAYGVLGVFLLVSAILLPQLDRQSLLPSFKENDLLVEMEGPPGASRSAMNRIVAKASAELRSIPGVRNVSAHIGRAILSDEIVDVNSSEIWVSIDTNADYDATVARVRDVMKGYPGVYQDVLTFLRERIREAATGEDEALVVRVYGQNLATLRDVATQLHETVSQVSGIVDAKIEQQVEEPALEIRPDLVRAQSYGLKPGDVRRAAATLLSGLEVGLIFEEQKVFDVVVWGAPETRNSISDVSNLLIDTPSGEHVRLKDVADLRITPTPVVIEREGVARRIDITANVSGRNVGNVAADVDAAIKQMKFPLEYHAEVLGDFAQLQTAHGRVVGFAIAAALGVFLLLQAAFNSWRLAIVAFVFLPAAVSGGIVMAYLAGGDLSAAVFAGIFAVFAIAARNSLALFRRYQHLEQEEEVDFGLDLVLRGTRERWIPIAATATMTAMAFLPFVVLGNDAGHEFLRPMALVIFGGLVTTLVASLFALPGLYLQVGAGTKPDMSLAEMRMEKN